MESKLNTLNVLDTSFDERFIEDYLGQKMSSDPITAVVELIANAWDAGAKTVKVQWPTDDSEAFSIIDDGHGMTAEEFSSRWTKLSYNRRDGQGGSVDIPTDNDIVNPRKAFGRNGKGRFSAFCFSEREYFVETKRNTDHNCFRVTMSSGSQPFNYESTPLPANSKIEHPSHGTAIYVKKLKHIGLTETKIRSEIGLRFLTDPDFIVELNGKKIQFNDIENQKFETIYFNFEGASTLIRVIQTDKSEKTTQRHGVAWHANNRLINECNWNGFRNDHILDGRTTYAKKYTFIVDASTLTEEIEADWSGFKKTDKTLRFYDLTKNKISDYLNNLTKEQRSKTSEILREENRFTLNQTGLLGNSRWNAFVENVQLECPKIKEDELKALAKILANLEASTHQYSLIYKLSEYTSNDLDSLDQILDEWNIDSAKAVLDEIKSRLLLIESIREKVSSPETLEVQELQPLFKKGLWIFGPEFESIEYTSNQGMTNVIKKLCKVDKLGTKNRPDFAILPDGSLSLHGKYQYDDCGNEAGISKVVIVELKKPGVPLGETEKNQCWKYAKELYEKGAILETAKIDCYLLGATIQEQESGVDTKRNGDVRK